MSHPCSDCDATFNRSEHLQRHRLRHADARPFACTECESAFARKDTLSRHMLAHNPEAKTTKRRRKGPYVSKACIACARSKQRCDGESPCARCTSKLLPCSYTASRNGELAGSPKTTANQDNDNGTSDTGSISQDVESIFDDNLEIRLATPVHATMTDSAMSTVVDTSAAIANLTSTSTKGQIPDPPCQPFFPSGLFIDDFTISTPFDSLEDWNLGNANITWNLDNSLFENFCAKNAQTAVPFSDNSLETSNQQSLLDHHSQAESEPVIEMLESEAPAPSFTQTIATSCSPGAPESTVSPVHLPNSQDTQKQITNADDPELWKAEDYHHIPSLTHEVYNMMVSFFARLNRENEYCARFTDKDLPALTHMNIFIQVYFEEFHPVFPLLHKATFRPQKEKWVIALAVAAIGCHFTKTLKCDEISYILNEFLRRTIHNQLERNRSAPPDIQIAQAAVLNQMGMLFGADMAFAEAAQTDMALIATLCRKIACYSNYDQFGMPLANNRSASQDWLDWVKNESKIRLFYCAWVLDSQQNCFHSFPPLIPIGFLQFSLPYPEPVWDAASEEEWQTRLKQVSEPPAPLRTTLLNLYRNMDLPKLSEVSILLLTMGVHCDAPRLRHAPVYLNRLYDHARILPPTKLRDAAMNLIHVISLLYYLPVRELFAFSGWQVTEAQQAVNSAKLRRWMQNKEQSRTILMHACHTWATIRSSRTAAQHEGMAMLVSVIAIWAWIELGEKPDSDDSRAWPTLRLDEAREDVKTWATSNQNRRIFLGGVGCLWDPGALARLLTKTTEILEHDIVWPFGKCLAKVLQVNYSRKLASKILVQSDA